MLGPHQRGADVWTLVRTGTQQISHGFAWREGKTAFPRLGDRVENTQPCSACLEGGTLWCSIRRTWGLDDSLIGNTYTTTKPSSLLAHLISTCKLSSYSVNMEPKEVNQITGPEHQTLVFLANWANPSWKNNSEGSISTLSRCNYYIHVVTYTEYSRPIFEKKATFPHYTLDMKNLKDLHVASKRMCSE